MKGSHQPIDDMIKAIRAARRCMLDLTDFVAEEDTP